MIRAQGPGAGAPARCDSVIFASGTTPESNTTNNLGIAALEAVRRPFLLRVRVAAPARGHVGARARATASPSPPPVDGARYVRLCTRVPRSVHGRAAPRARSATAACSAGTSPASPRRGARLHRARRPGDRRLAPPPGRGGGARRCCARGAARARVRVGAVACGASESGRSAACRGLHPAGGGERPRRELVAAGLQPAGAPVDGVLAARERAERDPPGGLQRRHAPPQQLVVAGCTRCTSSPIRGWAGRRRSAACRERAARRA